MSQSPEPAEVTPSPPARVLTPPYPNLGPEPLESDGGAMSPALVAALVAVAGLLVVVGLLRRVPRQRLRTTSITPSGPARAPGATPRERAVHASQRVREALVSQRGEVLRAKTTEELIRDLEPGVASEHGDGLPDLLRLADLAKFAGDRFERALELRVAQRGVEVDWDGWAEAVVSTLAAAPVAAGATSRINGK